MVEIGDPEGHSTGDKRRKEQLASDAAKSARTSFTTRSAGPDGQSNWDSGSDSDSDLISFSEIDEPKHLNDRSKVVAEHIASHLQMLMLLTLRFSTLINDKGVDHVEVNGDSVEADEGSSSSGSNFKNRILSDMDVEMDEEGLKHEQPGLDGDIRKDALRIPDCNFEVNIPPGYGILKANDDDEFMRGIIESGAFQSWRNKHAWNDEEPLEELIQNCRVEHADPITPQTFWGYAVLRHVMTRGRVMNELLSAKGGNFALNEAEVLSQIILPPVLPAQHHRRREVSGYQPAYLAIFALLTLVRGTRDVRRFLV